MSNTCLIAACATNATACSRTKPMVRKTYFNENFEQYYRIKFKMFLHFNQMLAVTPTDEEAYTGSIFAPLKMVVIKLVTIPARSVAIQHSFNLLASKCPGGPDNYVKDNLEQFTSSSVWSLHKDLEISKYLVELENRYNIILEPKSLDYTVQFCWEID